MKYLTREQMLLKVGPTQQSALVIFSQKEDFKFPVVDFGPDPNQVFRKRPTGAEPPGGSTEPDPNAIRYLAAVEYHPYSWSSRARQMSVEMTEEEYANLPDDPELKSLKGPGF